ncbi:MAG: O-antigen polymerase [Ignavibacterium sp.]|jgi:oligosaccharide repeat unit polymerase|nr:O-antigen polymerase [Ignavibacterium sp.]
MISLIVSFVSLVAIVIARITFKRWFNHLSLYVIIWCTMILLYDLKLFPYDDILPLTWFYIISSCLCFIFGIFTIISARKLFPLVERNTEESKKSVKIFVDGGTTVRYAILFFSIISIIGAVQHWIILIEKFGSIPGVLINANAIYILNTRGGIKGQVPFISNFGYVSIFFSAIYTAYNKKFTLLTFLPFLGIIIKEVATVGRAGMLLALMEFLFTFLLFRHQLNFISVRLFKFSKKNALISFTFLIILFITSASLVRLSRGATETYSGTNRSLSQFKDNLILSPSLYLYLSGHIGVLNKYSQGDGENTSFGQNTFLTFYHILDKLGVIKRSSDYQKGYFTPMWINTGTYIRELHADFGLTGVFLIPFLLGLIVTWLWYGLFKNNSLIILSIMVYLYIIIGFSFLVMITRTSYWSISLLLIIISIKVIEKIVIFVYHKRLKR